MFHFFTSGMFELLINYLIGCNLRKKMYKSLFINVSNLFKCFTILHFLKKGRRLIIVLKKHKKYRNNLSIYSIKILALLSYSTIKQVTYLFCFNLLLSNRFSMLTNRQLIIYKSQLNQPMNTPSMEYNISPTDQRCNKHYMTDSFL